MNTNLSLLLLFLLSITLFSCNPNREYKNEVIGWRIRKHQLFLDPLESPLSQEAYNSFSGLSYFEVKPEFKMQGIFKERPLHEKIFLHNTKNEEPRSYWHMGQVEFTYDNKTVRLQVFSNKDSLTDLFIPFTDKSTGFETYETGRYLETKVDNKNHIILDFNYAYNPYCAYNKEYSCTIPPPENNLSFKVLAGEKKFLPNKSID